MVIVISKEGQLCNRLWHSSNFYVNATANNYKVYYLWFTDYMKHFNENNNIKNNNHIKFIRTNKFSEIFPNFFNQLCFFMFYRLEIKKINLLFIELMLVHSYEPGYIPYDLNDPEFIKKAKSKIILLWGWIPRDFNNILLYKDKVLDLWTPNQNYIVESRNIINKIKENHDIVIGIHIRRTDFKKFLEGKYYYDLEYYLEVITKLENLVEFADKKVGFLVCSDEELVFDGFNKESIFVQKRHFMVDLIALSMCDFIVGPPSSFSLWASYYGSKPLMKLLDKEQKIEFSLFSDKYLLH